MYSVSFDPAKLVAECVDTIRAVTDAPLVNCDIALQSLLQILKPHFGLVFGDFLGKNCKKIDNLERKSIFSRKNR